jgi:hypothetical protein
MKLRNFFLGTLLLSNTFAGDLKSFLDELGATYNYSPPSSYTAGNYHVFAGPSIRLSIPNKSISLITFTPPRFKADCSGLDFSAGAIGYIAKNFQTIVSNFATLGVYGFLIGLVSSVPTIGEVMKWLQKIEELARLLQVKPCEVGMIIGQTFGQKMAEWVKTGEMNVSFSSTAEEAIKEAWNKIKSCVFQISDGNFNANLESKLTALGFSSNVAEIIAYNMYPVVNLNAHTDSSGKCMFRPIYLEALLSPEEILYGWNAGKSLRKPSGIGPNITYTTYTEPEASKGLLQLYEEKFKQLVDALRKGSLTEEQKRFLYSPAMQPYRKLVFLIAGHPEYEPILYPIARLFALNTLAAAINDFTATANSAVDQLLTSAKIEGDGKEMNLATDELLKWVDKIRQRTKEFRKFYYEELKSLTNELQVQLIAIEESKRLEKITQTGVQQILGINLSD